MPTPRTPQFHRLKIWPVHLAEVNAGRCFEIRRDDRDFQIGDIVIFEEWKPTDEEERLALAVSERRPRRSTLGEYTGAFFGPVEITHVTRSSCIPEGWCGFSFVGRTDGVTVRFDQNLPTSVGEG